MRRHARFLVLFAPLLALAAAPGLASADAKPPPPPPPPAAGAQPRTLRVGGEGKVHVAPDVAVVTFGVTAIDPSLAKATQQTTERTKKLQEVLRTVVAPADLQTSRYDVQVEQEPYDPQPAGARRTPRIAAYHVSNEIRAKVRDLSKVGSLLDRAVAAGANEVQGLQFQKDDTSGDELRALAAAVKVARAKAEEIARAAGVQLGEILDVGEGARGPGPIRPMMMSAMAKRSDVPVEAGELEVSAQVEVTFAIR
jgi:uncharacterized protein YggE